MSLSASQKAALAEAGEKSSHGSDAAEASANAGLTAEEMAQLRDERLATIRKAVESGDYDSDELLERSVRIMIERLGQDPESTPDRESNLQDGCQQ
ncbi:MAG: hypothetical protein KDA91_02875 [Planctomycetaceae bacterium]|nr:hypothetical protein [Planctomycetaceae bacterium]